MAANIRGKSGVGFTWQRQFAGQCARVNTEAQRRHSQYGEAADEAKQCENSIVRHSVSNISF